MENIAITDGSSMQKKNPNSWIEESNSRMITHIAKAGEEQNERVVVMSNDADVITYSLAYFSEFKRQGIKQIWVWFNSAQKRKDIIVDLMAEKFGEGKSLAFL